MIRPQLAILLCLVWLTAADLSFGETAASAPTGAPLAVVLFHSPTCLSCQKVQQRLAAIETRWRGRVIVEQENWFHPLQRAALRPKPSEATTGDDDNLCGLSRSSEAAAGRFSPQPFGTPDFRPHAASLGLDDPSKGRHRPRSLPATGIPGVAAVVGDETSSTALPTRAASNACFSTRSVTASRRGIRPSCSWAINAWRRRRRSWPNWKTRSRRSPRRGAAPGVEQFSHLGGNNPPRGMASGGEKREAAEASRLTIRREDRQRRGRDSNPGYGHDPVQRFSKPSLSATQPPLQGFRETSTIRRGARQSRLKTSGGRFPPRSRQAAPSVPDTLFSSAHATARSSPTSNGLYITGTAICPARCSVSA